MRVLMFGWEFPPHISGGLGTACFGLTHALKRGKTTIFFVVPKAHGDEDFPVVDASAVAIGEPLDEEDLVTHARRISGIHTVSVPAALTPYSADTASEGVKAWNWEYPAQTTPSVKVGSKIRYEFSGKYGPSLMDEVQRYGEVAGEIARQYSFQVIHAHDWLTYPAGVKAKAVSGRPLVVHVHATEFDRAGEKNIDKRVFEIEKQGMDEADLVIAVSEWTRATVIDKYGIGPRKIRVVHNGIIPDGENDFKNLHRVSDAVVTFLGRITYQKGPQYFIDAARKVIDHFPDTHFIMAGSGDLLPAMIDRVAQLKLSSRIHFTGFLKGKQIPQVWSITDLYVMPSVSEPFGITPLEAIQSGVPVIVSKQSGVAEVIDHAIKVDFWDSESLANAIIQVLKHKGLSETLRDNGRKEVDGITWDKAAKKIITLYYEILNKA